MYKKAVFILVTLLFALILNPVRVESYEQDNVLRDAFKDTGANFKDVKSISWAKFKSQKDVKIVEFKINKLFRSMSDKENASFKVSVNSQRTVVTEVLANNIEFDMPRINSNINLIEKNAENGSYISTVYEGYYSRMLSKEEMEIIIKQVRDYLNIVEDESYSDERMYVLQGYSPLITQYVALNGRHYNVNIAFRNDKLEERTYFFLGSPIISIEY